MLMRIIGFILFTLIIGGCATGAKKQTIQQSGYQGSSQAYQQDNSSSDYGDVQSTKTTYSAPVELSVKQIQRALKSAGFYHGTVDGKFGPKTKDSLIKFQKAHNLKTDGVAGKKTSAELNKYIK